MLSHINNLIIKIWLLEKNLKKFLNTFATII